MTAKRNIRTIIAAFYVKSVIFINFKIKKRSQHFSLSFLYLIIYSILYSIKNISIEKKSLYAEQKSLSEIAFVQNFIYLQIIVTT